MLWVSLDLDLMVWVDACACETCTAVHTHALITCTPAAARLGETQLTGEYTKQSLSLNHRVGSTRDAEHQRVVG